MAWSFLHHNVRDNINLWVEYEGTTTIFPGYLTRIKSNQFMLQVLPHRTTERRGYPRTPSLVSFMGMKRNTLCQLELAGWAPAGTLKFGRSCGRPPRHDKWAWFWCGVFNCQCRLWLHRLGLEQRKSQRRDRGDSKCKPGIQRNTGPA
jgi:hypothetical protein